MVGQIGKPFEADVYGEVETLYVVDHGVYDKAITQRYIGIVNDMGESVCTWTVCIPGVELEAGEVIVKTWSENEILRDPLLATGIFEDTGKRRQPDPASFVLAEIWKVKA